MWHWKLIAQLYQPLLALGPVVESSSTDNLKGCQALHEIDFGYCWRISLMFLKSADYWHKAPVPQRIYESLGPKMKFLVMLRDPVDRLHSDYSFNVSPSKNSRKSYFDSNGPISLSEFSHKYTQLAMLSFLYCNTNDNNEEVRNCLYKILFCNKIKCLINVL